MSERVVDPICQKAMFVVDRRGTLIRASEIRFAVFFKDQKMAIRGVLDPSTTNYEQITVKINLPFDAVSKPPRDTIFALPDKPEEDNWTVVFSWRNQIQYIRYGRWQGYLDKLVNRIETDSSKFRGLSGGQVDDAELFEE